MSWIWSSSPPSDEPLDSSTNPGSEEISIDPYSPAFPSENTGSTTTESFGTAFSDDIDYSASPSGPSAADSFDIYAPQPPTSFSTSPMDPISSPSLDFGGMARINPNVVSPRNVLRPRGPGDASPTVDYVFADDYKDMRKKSGAEQLTFMAGSAYLTGAILGGSRGFYEALRASAGKPAKLRLNAVLNGSGKRGSALANAFGVLALGFSLSESALYNYTNDETLGNYALAGALAGGIYKSTRGPRVAAVWAAAGAVTALGTVYASRQGYYGRGLQGVL